MELDSTRPLMYIIHQNAEDSNLFPEKTLSGSQNGGGDEQSFFIGVHQKDY